MGWAMPPLCMGGPVHAPEPSKAEVKRLAPLPAAAGADAFAGVLAALAGGVAALASAAESVDRVREPMRDALRLVAPTDELAAELAAAFDACAARVRHCAAFAEEAGRLLADAQSRSRGAMEALAAREAAWAPKLESDARAAPLSRRFARPLPPAEVRERLQSRHRANEDFRRHSADAEAMLSALARDEPIIVAQILAQLCRCFAAAARDDDSVADAFDGIAPRIHAAGEAAALSRSTPDESEATTAEEEGPESSEPLEAEAVAPEQGASADATAPSPSPAPSTADGRAAAGARPAASSVAPSASVSTQGVPQLASRGGSVGGSRLTLTEGSEVEIWSGSKQKWLAGTVEHIFATDSVSDGYRVPAGTVKVAFAHGVRFVRSGEVSRDLRPCRASADVD